MLNAELLEYIRTQLQRGTSEEELRTILRDVGWTAGQINTTLGVSLYDGDHVIETRDLTKYYGKKRGLLSLDLFVRRGEIFGFLGPNGAGKSTTIRLLLRLLRPTAGSIRVLGRPLDAHYDRILGQVGYLPGDVQLYERMTGRQMLTMLQPLYPQRDLRYADELIERLECDLDTRYARLSKGNRQKLGILMALFHKPQLAILDEPTTGLDPLTQNEFYRILVDLKREGSAVFFSSHNLYEVDRVCDRIGIIRQGELVDVETVSRLRGHQRKVIELHAPQGYRRDDFAAIEGVEVIDASDTFMRLHAADRAMPDVLIAIARAGITDLTIAYPDLEQVFLKYYGHS